MSKSIARQGCPDCGVPLVSTHTRFGRRWSCPQDGCTVVWWGKPRTRPANAETRKMRHQCHVGFDPIWRSGYCTRNQAYQRLADFMGLSTEKAHFGLFTESQCEKAMDLISAMRAEAFD